MYHTDIVIVSNHFLKKYENEFSRFGVRHKCLPSGIGDGLSRCAFQFEIKHHIIPGYHHKF